MDWLKDFGSHGLWLQIGTMGGIIALAALVHYIVKLATRGPRRRLREKHPFLHKLEETLRATLLSVLCLIGGYIAFEVFKAYSWHRGLLLKLTQLFWIVFGFVLLHTAIKHLARPGIARRATRFVLLPVVALLFVLHSLNLLVPILDFARAQSIGFGSFRISLYGLVLGAVLIFALYRFSVWLQGLLETRFLPKALGDEAASALPARLIAYTLLGLGAFIILDSLGVDLTILQIMAGAVGVGVGFGLQRIFLDFFAGLILMGERSIAPGHIVDIDGQLGTVKKVGFRSFVVETLDHVSLVVPNSSIVDGKLTNYTRDGNLVRLTVPVSVSYASDPRKVEEVLLEAASGLEGILKSVRPQIFFSGFGESSLDFIVAVWVRLDRARQVPVLRSELHYRVWDALKKHGISIPYPQMDLHIKDMPNL